MTKKPEDGDGSDQKAKDSRPEVKTENLNPDRTVSGSQVQGARETNDNILDSVRQLPTLQPGMSLEEAKRLQNKMDAFGIDYGDYIETSSGTQLKQLGNAPDGPPPAGSAEDIGLVLHTPAEQTGASSYNVGLDLVVGIDPRTPGEKFNDFFNAAVSRATDPKGWQTYLDGQVQKFIGIGEGLNIGKEHTKEAVAAGWKALTDGTVANFLAQPNAINEPLFKTVGGALDAMAQDPNAVNHALERLANQIQKESDHYSSLPSREQGKVIGEAAFFLFNPEGSTEGGEIALKALDTVATHVDKAVIETVQASMKLTQEMAATSPELAAKSRQLLYEHLRHLGLTQREMELAGVPRGYFDGIKTSANQGENIYAMSKADDLEGKASSGKKFNDTAGGDAFQIDKETGRIQRTDLGKVREPYAWRVINEEFSNKVVRQSFEDSCISATGEMLTEGRLTEAQLIELIGRPGDIDELAKHLAKETGEAWTSKKGPTSYAKIGEGGPWAAELDEYFWKGTKGKTPHIVVVDGPGAPGNLRIRDPIEGTRYEMSIEEFQKAWDGRAAYRTVNK